MLINALCDYADKLEELSQNKTPIGYSKQKVHFQIMLNINGEITNIIDVREVKEIPSKKENGKPKTQSNPIEITLPERTQKTSVCSNIIEHRPLYIFGLNLDKGEFTPNDKTNKAKKSHEDFVTKNLNFFQDLTSPICVAHYNFIKKWQPELEVQNQYLIDIVGSSYKNSYFCFGLEGHPEITLHEDTQFKKKYQESLTSSVEDTPNNSDDNTMCAISGEKLPIARIHDKIKFPNGNSSGCVLVGMKESAYQSYGKAQSYNSNISEVSMKKYTSTLNKLIASDNHHIILDDMTIIYFAMKSDDNAECNAFSHMFGSSKSFDQNAQDTNTILGIILKNLKDGNLNNLEKYNINKDVTFYVVGLTPNNSRICQKFIYRDTFGNIMKNIVQHQKDITISTYREERPIYFSQIFKELISPKATNGKVPPPLMSAIMTSALNGTLYPNALLETVIRRIKTDSDEEKNPFIKINDVRVGLIKGCINRKLRKNNKQEEFQMSLDLENNQPAYLCGRLFAVLEKIQQEAYKSDNYDKDKDKKDQLNSTIKDRYFSSACSRPAIVFPILMKLSQNHLKKLSVGSNIYYQKVIGEITDKLSGEFPSLLDLENQGRFIIGYYHQNKDIFISKKDTQNNENN